MASFSFEIAENLSEAEGGINAYFAVQTGGATVAEPVLDVIQMLKEAGRDAKIIPVITNEFGGGKWLVEAITAHMGDIDDRVGGIVTFGRKVDILPSKRKRYSHFDVLGREMQRERPDFLLAKLKIPTEFDPAEWENESGLEELHFQFGSFEVSNTTATLAAEI